MVWGDKPNQPPPNIGENQEEEDELDDDLDEIDQAPPQFFKDVRNLIPNASQRDCFLGWDRTVGIGSKGEGKKEDYNLASIRVQAAIEFIIDLYSGASKNNNNNSIQQLLPAVQRQPKNDVPLFRLPSPATPPSVIRVNDSSDDEDDDEIEIISQKFNKRLDKGKGKAKVDEPIILGDSSDEDEVEDLDEIQILSQTQFKPKSKSKEIIKPTPQIQAFQPSILTESEAVAMILAIVPDVLPSHVRDLIRSPEYINPDSVVEILWASEYPKQSPKKEVLSKKEGKKRAREEEVVVQERDYLAIKGRPKGDEAYNKATLEQLYVDYDLVPSTMIRDVLKINFGFYSPTYVNLSKIVKRGEFEAMTRARPDKKLKEGEVEVVSKELEKEKKWLKKTLTQEREDNKRIKLLKKQEEHDKKHGLLIECECCFGDFVSSTMVACTEAHLFCRDCISGLVKNQIGSQQYKLNCMTEDCEGIIREVEASKVVSPKSILALQKIRMEKELDEAGFEGLAKCPFCPYACVIDNPDERLFRCEKSGCMKVSCRSCQRLEHLPKTCAEAKKDDNLGVVHGVEEAMSLAAIRTCPKCTTPYIKSDGCNMIHCSSCGAGSCFICRKLIKGYEHFTVKIVGGTGDRAGCNAHDDTETRIFEEIERARKVATYTALQANPNVVRDELDPLALVKPVRGAPIYPPQRPRAQLLRPPPPYLHYGNNMYPQLPQFQNHLAPLPQFQNQFPQQNQFMIQQLRQLEEERRGLEQLRLQIAGMQNRQNMNFEDQEFMRREGPEQWGNFGGGVDRNNARAGPAPRELTEAERREQRVRAAERRAGG